MRLEALARAAIADALKRLAPSASREDIPLERPEKPEFGDISSRIAFTLAKELKRPPQAIAQDLAAAVSHAAFEKAVAAGGFLNLYVRPEALRTILREILLEGESYGDWSLGEGKPLQVEFVSSNPTGPLTVGHGRQAALGDALANLFSALGWRVTREYYLNDEGRQIELLAQSLWARYRQALGEEVPIPEGGYHGDYLVPIGEELAREWGNRYPEWTPQAAEAFGRVAVERMMGMIHEDLAAIGVSFDVWSREGDLHRRGLVREVFEALREKGAVYEKDGAYWMNSTAYGLSRDPVLIRSDGTSTAGDSSR